MKRYIENISRDQGTLFPDHLEDWINDENVVRVIDAFVDELDLVDLVECPQHLIPTVIVEI